MNVSEIDLLSVFKEGWEAAEQHHGTPRAGEAVEDVVAVPAIEPLLPFNADGYPIRAGTVQYTWIVCSATGRPLVLEIVEVKSVDGPADVIVGYNVDRGIGDETEDPCERWEAHPTDLYSSRETCAVAMRAADEAKGDDHA